MRFAVALALVAACASTKANVPDEEVPVAKTVFVMKRSDSGEPASRPVERTTEKEEKPAPTACHEPDEVAVGKAGTGSIKGMVVSKGKGDGIAGVTVVATSSALQGTMAEITDDDGQYLVTQLPAGIYDVTFYFSEQKVARHGIAVRGATTRLGTERLELGEATIGETFAIGRCAQLHTLCPPPSKDDEPPTSIESVPCACDALPRVATTNVGGTTGVIAGVTRDAAGKPLNRVSVLAATMGHEYVATVDNDGTYVLDDLVPGSYVVKFSLGNNFKAERALVVDAGRKYQVDHVFDLKKPGPPLLCR